MCLSECIPWFCGKTKKNAAFCFEYNYNYVKRFIIKRLSINYVITVTGLVVRFTLPPLFFAFPQF